MRKVYAVIDMKAFYSYVECVERGLDPHKVPLIVADKSRGKNTIVLSVTPYLKKLGVPSRLRILDLPKGINYIYAVPRMALYMKKSAEVVSTILDFIAEEDIHVYSVDEAFVNLGPYLNYYKMNERELCLKIKKAIKDRLGLEATCGIGDNMFLAKVALDLYAKKGVDGIGTLYKSEIEEKLWPVTPLSKIWGIGPRIEARLNALGLYSVRDVAFSSPLYLETYFKSFGEELYKRANGIDESDLRDVYVPKDTSFASGQTLFQDYSKEEIPLILKEVSDELSFRLRKEGYMGDTVHLFIGYSKEGGFSAQMKLLRPVDTTEEIFSSVMEIFKKHMEDNKMIRQVSISLSGLKEYSGVIQGSLFEDMEEKIEERNLLNAMDQISIMYGRNSILRCSALLEKSTVRERHNQIGGHRR